VICLLHANHLHFALAFSREWADFKVTENEVFGASERPQEILRCNRFFRVVWHTRGGYAKDSSRTNAPDS